MKKTLLLVLFIMVSVFYASALGHLQDVVYLKNGSIIRGIIVEQVPNESIKVETRDGNIFVYKMDEIQKIAKETSNYRMTAGNSRNYAESQFNKSCGYLGLVEIGGGIGIGDWGADRVSLTMINGYRVVPQFALGVGIGVEMFAYTSNYGVLDYSPEFGLPIFLHLRSDFVDGKVSPYAAFNVGYNVSLSGGFFDGLMLEPTLGVSFNVGSNNRMTAGVSYAMNRVKYAYYGYSYHYEDKATGSAIKLKIGFSF